MAIREHRQLLESVREISPGKSIRITSQSNRITRTAIHLLCTRNTHPKCCHLHGCRRDGAANQNRWKMALTQEHAFIYVWHDWATVIKGIHLLRSMRICGESVCWNVQIFASNPTQSNAQVVFCMPKHWFCHFETLAKCLLLLIRITFGECTQRNLPFHLKGYPLLQL